MSLLNVWVGDKSAGSSTLERSENQIQRTRKPKLDSLKSHSTIKFILLHKQFVFIERRQRRQHRDFSILHTQQQWRKARKFEIFPSLLTSSSSIVSFSLKKILVYFSRAHWMDDVVEHFTIFRHIYLVSLASLPLNCLHEKAKHFHIRHFSAEPIREAQRHVAMVMWRLKREGMNSFTSSRTQTHTQWNEQDEERGGWGRERTRWGKYFSSYNTLGSGCCCCVREHRTTSILEADDK